MENNNRRPLPRGLRNCNPGNIRRSAVRYLGEVEGTDPQFKSFVAAEWGYRAMFVLLHTYRRRHGCRTLAAAIARYAPPSENFTAAYVRRVADLAHLDPEAELDTLSPAVMIPVVGAMSQVENGRPADMAAVRAGWELFAGS